jgi:hypothetical protein
MGYTTDKATIAALSEKYGPMLLVDPDIDAGALMYAIAGRESSFGHDFIPRHEPAYDVGGAYANAPTQAKLLQLYGRAAACSYGPWQVMLDNCAGFTPNDLLNPENGARAFVHFLNGYVIATRHAHTIEQIAQTYNSGNFEHEATGEVLDYVQTVRKYYDARVTAKQGGTA